jgi:hypothetical protein
MMGNHSVKTHHWYDGVLHTIEHFFDNVEEAMDHAVNSEHHVVKVYTPAGELIHSAENGTPEERSIRVENTYA